MDGLEIRSLSPGGVAACDAIIASLPYHFGDAAGQAEYAAAVRSQEGLVVTSERTVRGFLTTRTWFGTTCEITWMAVHADWRGRGVGSQLMAQLVRRATRDGLRFLLVTTLSASMSEPGVDDGYARTRAFYESCGFAPVWEPRGWWSGDSQAVLMLRALPASA